MYDIASKTVNRLKGELSSAFVNVAEANANAQDDEHVPVTLTDSGIFEQMSSTSEEADSSFTSFLPEKPIVAKESDISVQDSEPSESNVENRISISSGYSVIKR